MLARLKPYFRIVIAAIMLYLLYKSGLLQLSKIKDALNNRIIIVSGFTLFAVQLLVFAVRFKIVVSLVQKIQFTLSLKLQLIGQFFNTFIPGGVGGDVVKAIELSLATKKNKRTTLALTLVDRVVGLYGLIIFSFAFLLFEVDQLSDVHTKYLNFSGALFLIATLCFVFRKKIASLFSLMTHRFKNSFISNVKDSILNFFGYLDIFLKFKYLSPFIIVSFVAQILSVSFLYIVVYELSINPPPYTVFFPLACFGFVAMAIPVTPGGIGYGQAAFYFIFRSLGDSTAEAAIVGISMMQLFNIFFSLPGGYYFIRSTHRGSSARKSVDI